MLPMRQAVHAAALTSCLTSPRLASPSATDRPVSRLAWRLRTRPSSFQIIPRCTCTCTCTGCTLRRRAAATHGAPPGLVAASLPCQKLQTCLSVSPPSLFLRRRPHIPSAGPLSLSAIVGWRLQYIQSAFLLAPSAPDPIARQLLA
ncbi:hypothetical protein L1887_48166 [Cichorium endivia]|nr:hypothetical protein L1887_48166 [Cichorium endivia]